MLPAIAVLATVAAALCSYRLILPRRSPSTPALGEHHHGAIPATRRTPRSNRRAWRFLTSGNPAPAGLGLLVSAVAIVLGLTPSLCLLCLAVPWLSTQFHNAFRAYQYRQKQDAYLPWLIARLKLDLATATPAQQMIIQAAQTAPDVLRKPLNAAADVIQAKGSVAQAFDRAASHSSSLSLRQMFLMLAASHTAVSAQRGEDRALLTSMIDIVPDIAEPIAIQASVTAGLITCAVLVSCQTGWAAALTQSLLIAGATVTVRSWTSP